MDFPIRNEPKPPSVNKISTQQQSPVSPFKINNKKEQAPFTAEQTNSRNNEPISPFALSNSPKLSVKTSSHKSPGNVPISPFNMGSPSSHKSPGLSHNTKGKQIFSSQEDMPFIPKLDTYTQANNRTNVVTTTTAVNGQSPAFYETKRELNMSNINSMVSNVRKGQETNVIDKILYDTLYSGAVDHNVDKELVRHNCNNNTLFKCFSRSSSGIFSFKSPDTAPNINSIYYVEPGGEVGTTKLVLNKDKENEIKKGSQQNLFQNRNVNLTTTTIMEKEDVTTFNDTPIKPSEPKKLAKKTAQSNNTNTTVTSTFTYDPEYLCWRETLIEILKNNSQESESYGNKSIGSFFRNINNENQIDYMLRMPIELLTLLNIKIK